MSGTSIHLLLVDDHPLVLEGIGAHLGLAADLEVTATAGTASEALDFLAPLPPDAIDVAVIDLSLPDLPGLELIARLRRLRPRMGIVVLTMHEDEGYVLRALSLGARGYVLKDQSADDLASAIRAVHAGHSCFSPRITGYLVNRVATGGCQPRPERLTEREEQVLRMIAGGQTNRDVAAELFLSVRTVETYRERLMKKLDLHSIADLTRYAVARGLVDTSLATQE